MMMMMMMMMLICETFPALRAFIFLIKLAEMSVNPPGWAEGSKPRLFSFETNCEVFPIFIPDEDQAIHPVCKTLKSQKYQAWLQAKLISDCTKPCYLWLMLILSSAIGLGNDRKLVFDNPSGEIKHQFEGGGGVFRRCSDKLWTVVRAGVEWTQTTNSPTPHSPHPTPRAVNEVKMCSANQGKVNRAPPPSTMVSGGMTAGGWGPSRDMLHTFVSISFVFIELYEYTHDMRSALCGRWSSIVPVTV